MIWIAARLPGGDHPDMSLPLDAPWRVTCFGLSETDRSQLASLQHAAVIPLTDRLYNSCCRTCSQLGSDGYNSAFSPASTASTPRLASATSGGGGSGGAPRPSAGGRQEAPAAPHYLESQLSFRVGEAAAVALLMLAALHRFCWLSSCC